MNRIDRLLAILLLLQHQHKIRAIDLATRFEVTERTIYRDIQALNEMGIPVVGIAGSGYELLETFRLPPIMLSHDEAIALSLGSRMLKTFATGKIALDAELALKRIENILPPPIRQSVAQLAQIIDFFPPPTRFDWHNPMLHSVIAAIQTSQVLQLTYHAYMETTASQRQVEPHTLTFSEGVWYLNGFCRLRQDMRSFRFNRIESLEILEEHFQPRQIFPAPKTVIAVMVHFKADVVPHLKERQHYAFVEEADENIMVYHVQDLREIRDWILGYGSAAQVIQPPELREWLREEAQRLINLLT